MDLPVPVLLHRPAFSAATLTQLSMATPVKCVPLMSKLGHPCDKSLFGMHVPHQRWLLSAFIGWKMRPSGSRVDECIAGRIGYVWATPTLTPEMGLPLRLPSCRQPKPSFPPRLSCSFLLPLYPVNEASPQHHHHRQDTRLPTQPKVKR